MDKEGDQAIVNNIVAYAEQKNIHGMLKEYMRRLIVNQPDDPLKFLIASITENPFKIPASEVSQASAPAAESEAAWFFKLKSYVCPFLDGG